MADLLVGGIKMIKKYKFLLILFFLVGCNIFDSPTETKPEDLFKLSITYNNERITDFLAIPLNWDEITLENFKEIKITRLNEHRDPGSYFVGETDNGWITIKTFTNEFTTSWVDTVKDDASFIYRIEYYDIDNNYRRAEEVVTILPTTHLTIPIDVEEIKAAVESYIIDNGDIVYIQPGIYTSHSFSFGEKDVSLIGIEGAQQTILNWEMRMADVEPLADTSFITIQAGLLQGIGVMNSYGTNGGGINAKGNSKIKQCIIRKNVASDRPVGPAVIPNSGYGGGLHLSGQVIVENCIIDSNEATKKGGGIYIDALANNVQIINCVLSANDLHSESMNVSIENTIITGVLPTISADSVSPLSINYSHVGETLGEQNLTNISGEILFERLTDGPQYYLLPGSVCIDAGNPDPVFNDPDGSQNDIGAYGGPLGGW